jgi:hypothetical protein
LLETSTGYLTRAAFQRETGKARSEVDRLLVAGMPHKVTGQGRGSEIQIPRDKAMAWLATRALDGKGKPGGRAAPLPEPPPEPEWPPAIRAIMDETSTDLERGYALALMLAVYETPRVVGGMAIQAGVGLTMDQAYEISRAATAGMLHVLFEEAARAGVEPFASAAPEWPAIICPAAFVRLDWRKVAANAGESGWRPPRSIPGWVDGDDDEGEVAADGVTA